jgi:hypothetical protein
MSDDLITAAVKSGQYGDEESERIVIRALIDRRDAILRAYLPAVNPIVDPVLERRTLTFRNAAVDARVAEAPESYRAQWHRFDNATGEVTSIGETSSSRPEIAAPADLPSAEGTYLRVDVAASGGRAEWQRPAHLYFRRSGEGWKLVGLYRLGDEPTASGERLRFGRLGGAADYGLASASGSAASPPSSASRAAAGI